MVVGRVVLILQRIFSFLSGLFLQVNFILMYWGFQRFRSLGMSSPQLFLVQEDESDASFNTSLKDASQHRRDGLDEIAPGGPELQEESKHIRTADDKKERPDGLEEIAPAAPEFQEENKVICTADDNKEDHRCTETSASSTASKKPSLRQSEVADEDDGFTTPTSSDHKIPVITQCPPAPKKIRPNPSTKRKASPRIRRNLQLDLSREVELMFPPTVQDDLGSKIKKARREDSS